jgi:hypothetical protein
MLTSERQMTITVPTRTESYMDAVSANNGNNRVPVGNPATDQMSGERLAVLVQDRDVQALSASE